MAKFKFTESSGITGRVFVTIKDKYGNIIQKVSQNTIQNTLKDAFAQILRYGTKDVELQAGASPTLLIEHIRFTTQQSCCYDSGTDNLADISAYCGDVLQPVTGQTPEDATAIVETYKYILDAASNQNKAQVRFGIVIPMEYEFTDGNNTYGASNSDNKYIDIYELLLLGNVGGNPDTLIAWTCLGTPVTKGPENIASIVWQIEIS